MIKRALHWLHVYRGRGAAKLPFGIWLTWTLCGDAPPVK